MSCVLCLETCILILMSICLISIFLLRYIFKKLSIKIPKRADLYQPSWYLEIQSFLERFVFVFA